MRKVIPLLAVLLFLVACRPTTPGQSVDLGPLNARIDALTTAVDDLAAAVDALAIEVDGFEADFDAIEDDIDGFDGTIRVLTEAAIALEGTVAKPIDLNRVQWGSFAGIVVHTSPPDLSVVIDIGPCPDDQPRGWGSPYSKELVASSFHPLEPGTYCLRSYATEEWLDSGVTITITPGVMLTAKLYPERRPIEE